MKSAKVVCFFLLFFTSASISFALNSKEMFDNGKRAFDMGRFREAELFFGQFIKTWPSHARVDEADYFRNLSLSRFKPDETESRITRIASLTERLNYYKTKLPESADLSELQAELEFLNLQTGSIASASLASYTSTDFLSLSPSYLLHFIDRGWVPPTAKDPWKLLNWLHKWHIKNDLKYHPKLDSKIAFLKAKCLFRIFVAPLVRKSLAEKLSNMQMFPIHTALRTNLKTAFEKGDHSTKRKSALLGISLESLLNNEYGSEYRFWFSYLKQRGQNDSDAWCPLE
ncbi:MAG: hypothetical protein HQM10_11855 [Candidatus Riflebacteria bacterium]|nr:hypothetical protein [Candidatus Riflebacteria bacterium]